MDASYPSLVKHLLRATKGLKALCLAWEAYRRNTLYFQTHVISRIIDGLPNLHLLKSLTVTPMEDDDLRILTELARSGGGANGLLRLEYFSTSLRCLGYDDAEACSL